MRQFSARTVTRRPWFLVFLMAASLAAVSPVRPAAAGETIYAITPGNVLIRFDGEAPNAVTTIGLVTGLAPGDVIRGIDFRPRTGQLYAVTVPAGSPSTSVLKSYALDPLTAVATLVGQTATALPGAGDVATGLDFNPTVDRLRYVNTNDENARLNPNNGLLAGDDTNLTPAPSEIIAEAYDRNFDRLNAASIATTLYGIDRASSTLVVQGGLNGAGPGGPNGGAITPVGGLGFTLDAVADGGFDIVPSPGAQRAFAALTDNADDLTRLYAINLGNGVATSLGAIGNGATQVVGIAVAPRSLQVVGADAGGSPHVRALDGATGTEKFSFFPYPIGFTGGVRVAAGDVTGDGVADIITGAGPGGGPHVRVFDGATGAQVAGPIGSFFAFTAGFTGGVHVAAGDVNGDGFDDVIVGADAGGGPHVRVFSGATGAELVGFFAYDTGFAGGVRVAAADFDLDGDAEIITAAGPGGGPDVRVFSGAGTPFTGGPPGFANSFFAYAAGFTGGVFVAAGDVNGDGRPDIVTGAGAGGGPHVKAFSGMNGVVFASFFAYAPGFTGGVRVGVTDVNADGRLEIVTGAGPGGGPHVRAFDGLTLAELDGFFAFAPGFSGGVQVGGQRQ